MARKWRLTWLLFALQFLIAVIMIGGGFAGVVSEKFIFEKYFLIYAPLMFLATGGGFLAAFFFLPVIMFVYSFVIAAAIVMWKREQSEDI